MKQVCVLGNGQLGRMLRQAGEPLGIAVWPVGLDAEPAAVPFQQSVITAEIERWPETALTRELARHPAFVNRDVFPIIADRLTQKQLFDKLEYQFPDRHITLWFFLVESWQGEPWGKEGQPGRWMAGPTLDPAAFPPANEPVISKLIAQG